MRHQSNVRVYLSETTREPLLVGTLRPSYQGDVLASSSFEYDRSYVDGGGYALSPDLRLVSGRLFAPESSTLFGAFSDAAPDEWGQRIIQTAHSRSARATGSAPRRVNEFDYLLGVADETRMGALRFRASDADQWLSSDEGVANLHDLPRILEAARRYEAHEATDEDIAYLNGIATSPGGARPKANVRLESGRLALAKLPHSKDGNFDAERWEAVALTLAKRAGLRTVPFTVEAAPGGKAVLVVERFDRCRDGGRRGYMSAATAMELGKHNSGSNLTYLDLADTVAEVAAAPRAELRELYGRVALTTFVNNVDDHWRNHGFLRVQDGWVLSPIFGVNPSRLRGVVNSRRISTGSAPGERDIRDLLESSQHYRLRPAEAARIAADVAAVVDDWASVAAQIGLASAEISAMADAFDASQRGYARDAVASFGS